ncbi:MAG: STAS domain-containing protein [bacterium]
MIDFLNTGFSVKSIPSRDGNRALCLKLDGVLAGDNVYKLKQMVDPIFFSPNPPELKLAMDGVSYMDSMGVGIIVGIIKKMRDIGGKLEITGLNETGRELIQILRLSHLSEIVTVSPE